jgi:hypothetical protein
MKSENESEIVELDEIHPTSGTKKYCWTWIAVDSFTPDSLF